jgi:acetyltransferase-like isoleucine patch superfamily enzyme
MESRNLKRLPIKVVRKLISLLSQFVNEVRLILRHIILHYPNSEWGLHLRKFYYGRVTNLKIGKNPLILYGVTIHNDSPVEIGDNFQCGNNVVIDPSNSLGIIIGNNVGIADGCYLRAGNHKYDSFALPIIRQGHNYKRLLSADGREASIIIEDDVWIGARSILLSGTKIGKGSIISAGSILASLIPENSLVAGNPARVIANRTKVNFIKDLPDQTMMSTMEAP